MRETLIASNVGGLGENIIDGYNGVLCESENREDFVDKINKMLEYKERMKKYSSNAVAFVKQRYSIEKTYAIMKEIYDDVLERI